MSGFVVLDTDVVSTLQRGSAEPSHVEYLADATGCITFVTVGEFYRGAYKNGWSAKRRMLVGSAGLAATFVGALAQTPAPNEGLPLPKSPPPTVVHNNDGSTSSISQSGRGTKLTTVDQNGALISTVYKTPNSEGGRTTIVEAGTVTYARLRLSARVAPCER